MNINNLYQTFSIIPLRGKRPLVKGWTRYKNEKIEYEKIQNHKGNFGIVCGYNDLEVIDIDNHFQDADKLLQYVKDNMDLEKYMIIGTGGGGYHIYYYCSAVGTNQKLASRKNDDNRAETLIETRGAGGQVVWYDNILQGTTDSIPTIDAEEREMLLDICKSLNEVEQKKQKDKRVQVSGERPGDMYNNDLHSIQATKTLLKAHGWQEIRDGYWKRPGKDSKGISATFGKVGKNKFYVFSSNADPFQSETSYSMLGVLTELEYSGDYSASAKYLGEKYSVTPKPKEKPAKEPIKNKKWRVLEEIINEWNLYFRYNTRSKVFTYRKGRNGDYESLDLLVGDIIREMEVNRDISSISKTKVSEMVMNSTYCEMYDPIQTFFDKLPKWDGSDHIAEICKYIQLHPLEDAVYFESMLRKHLIRTVRCALEKDDVNRMVLVFHGPQEIGKTRFFRWLTEKELYYEESIDPGNKDSILALSKYMVINIDELDSLMKKEIARLKAFISKGEITRRVPYGRHDEQFPRIASFVASTNKADVLTDTVNTRWIMLKVKKFKWKKYIKAVNPLQIWAQAVSAYNENKNAGELSSDEKRLREKRNTTEFLEISQEREILIKYFRESDKHHMTTTDAKMAIEKNLHPMRVNLIQLGRELHRLFGEPQSTTIDGRSGRFYNIYHLFTEKTEDIGFYEQQHKVGGDDDLPF